MSIFPRIIFDANVLTYLYKLGLLDVCLDAVEHPYPFDLIRDVELKDMPWEPVVREKIDVLSLDPKQMADADSYRSTEGWTIDTLISSHKSMPYNPSIAGVFYRAGYIENWGRGITKIYESCENLGAPKPEYEIIGYGISVRFPALQSAIITAPKLKNDALDDALESRIIAMLRVTPQLTQQDLVNQLDSSRASVQRSMKNLVDTGKIVRIGGKRFGHWQVQD